MPTRQNDKPSPNLGWRALEVIEGQFGRWPLKAATIFGVVLLIVIAVMVTHISRNESFSYCAVKTGKPAECAAILK